MVVALVYTTPALAEPNPSTANETANVDTHVANLRMFN